MQETFDIHRMRRTHGTAIPAVALTAVLGLAIAAGGGAIAHDALHLDLPVITALTTGGIGKLVALGLGLAALWTGSLWMGARQHARVLADAPRPANCPQRRALNGCTSGARRLRRLDLAKMAFARFRDLLAEHPGRRVEDKMVLLLGVASRCRGLCLFLLAAASMASLYGMMGR